MIAVSYSAIAQSAERAAVNRLVGRSSRPRGAEKRKFASIALANFLLDIISSYDLYNRRSEIGAASLDLAFAPYPLVCADRARHRFPRGLSISALYCCRSWRDARKRGANRTISESAWLCLAAVWTADRSLWATRDALDRHLDLGVLRTGDVFCRLAANGGPCLWLDGV